MAMSPENDRCSDELAAACVMLVSFFWATVGWGFGCNLWHDPRDITFPARVYFLPTEPSPCSDPPPTLPRCTSPLVAGTRCR